MAMLLVLETLTPTQRAVSVFHEVFDLGTTSRRRRWARARRRTPDRPPGAGARCPSAGHVG